VIAAGRKYMLDQWWVAAMPGLAIALVSLGFFAGGTSSTRAGYVGGFRVALACDLALAAGSLVLSRLLAPRSERGG